MESTARRPAATVDEVLITSELAFRPSRPADHAAEGRALVAIAAAMAESPRSVLQKLADAALELCRAGSAGISVWEPGGEDVFHWHATAGEYAPYLGGTMPRGFSPCGTVLDRDAALLMADPVRYYPYIAELRSPVREVLLVPFYRGDTPVGTVWVVAHAADRHFDAEDARLVASLAKFAGAAVLTLSRIEAAERAERVRREHEADLRRQTDRMRLLWEAAALLLTADDPDAMLHGLFGRVASHFGLDAYFNFMVDDAGDALRLASCHGVPDEALAGLHRLEFGQAICGAVARSREAITATCIQSSDDPRVQLAKSLGLRAYTCNPLLAGGRLLGTLSFASRGRDDFDPDEVEFLRTISRYVAVAYERLHLIRELRAADRKKDDFIALLAHELRNPLAPIRNGLQVLRLADGDPAAQARAREMMARQLTHMVRLIDDLLDVSRINRNKMELRKGRVALADVVAAAVETARPALDAAGHELTVTLPGGPVHLDADLTRLAQVFSNLLTNSAKYTPPGGRVWLAAERRDGRVEVAVRDTGIGIPAGSLRTIFDMFSQVDRAVERSTGGLGIGLALVKGLVEMHGGTVAAASPGEGAGSTFTVTLPVLADRPASDGVPAGDGPARKGRRVLVVDDNRDGADSLAMMLRLLGDEVATANDGVEAVEAAAAFRPEVILMDVGMPRLNGLDATRRIREQAWGKAVTVIALTGWGQEGDRERSREAGCDGHLVKPVNLADLEALLAGRPG